MYTDSITNKYIMKYYKKEISEIIIFQPELHTDQRGCFYESYVKKFYDNIIGRDLNFVQENVSISKSGVLRGMHCQIKPYEQAKLISVVKGEVFDVALDIRENSPTYAKWTSEILSSENNKRMWIPEGFAHGFLALTDEVILNYKTTDYYSPNHEINFKYDDPRFSISWPNNVDYIISEKDS